MSTHARVGIKLDNNMYAMTYVHYDGYPEHTGRILVTKHDSYEKATSLLRFDLPIRSLSENGEVNYFDDGESGEFETIEDALNGVEYVYVFVEKWRCYSSKGEESIIDNYYDFKSTGPNYWGESKMKKIVINQDFGGFSLSEKAMRQYCEIAFIDYETVTTGYGSVLFYKAGHVGESDHYICNYDFDRDDKILVHVVEQLKEEANGPHASLKIVEIPDDVKWFVDEYDGRECIREAHRVWS